MHSPMVLANSWFIRRRALAMTLISSSIGIGGTIITPMLAFSVQTWGWREGAFLAGLGLILTGVPLALLVQRSPESMGLFPDGALPAYASATHDSHVGNAKTQEANFTLSQAMRTRAFWMIILATTTRVAVYNSLTVHFIPVMVWKGVSEQRAAAMLAIMALMSLPSHLLVGWIADQVSKPRLMGACMAIGTASLLFLAYGKSQWSLWVFTILFYVHGGDFSGGLGDRGRLLRPKVVRNHPGHHELLLPLGTCVGPRHYRCDLRSLSQLCSNDVRFHHSRPDR